MKIAKGVAWVLLFVLIGMQFYSPTKNSAIGEHTAVFLSETNPPKEVQRILETTCYDCHSNNTHYPWYNNIAPVSYWLADHIRVGKGHLNFSEWESYTPKKKDHKLEELIEEVEEGEMPLKEYTWTHKEARLTANQKEMVMEWARKSRILYQLGPQPE
ncbi:heme-binding domain-containing protein [Sediminicola sp. 1XM1-17]|uniref:heme-binding domain-containing protein n=1 Tax=Sediminicola sp. 1XM1-17 TaxID=3127702 RepID=UPI00307745ED